MRRQSSATKGHISAAPSARNENASLKGNGGGRKDVNSNVHQPQVEVDTVVVASTAAHQDSCPTSRTLSRAAAVAASASSAAAAAAAAATGTTASAPASPASQLANRREGKESSFSGPEAVDTAQDGYKMSFESLEASSSGWQASDELPSASALVELNSPTCIDNQGTGSSNSDSAVRQSQETRHNAHGGVTAKVDRATSQEDADPFTALAMAMPPSVGDGVSEERLTSLLPLASSQHQLTSPLFHAPTADWTCSVCTYANGALDSMCLMCDTLKSRGNVSNASNVTTPSAKVHASSETQSFSSQFQESLKASTSTAAINVPQPPVPPSFDPFVRHDDESISEHLKDLNVSIAELSQTASITATAAAVEADTDEGRRGGREGGAVRAGSTAQSQLPFQTEVKTVDAADTLSKAATAAISSFDATSIVHCSDCRRSMPLANLELHRLRCPKAIDQRAKDRHNAVAHAYRSSTSNVRTSEMSSSRTTLSDGFRSTGNGGQSLQKSSAGVVPDNASVVSKEVGPPSPPPLNTSPRRITTSGYLNNLSSLRPPPAGSPSAGKESISSHNSSTSGSRRSSGPGGSSVQGGSTSSSKRWSPEKPWGASRGNGAAPYAPKSGQAFTAKTQRQRQCASKLSKETVNTGRSSHPKTTDATPPLPARPLPSYMRSTVTSKSRQQRP